MMLFLDTFAFSVPQIIHRMDRPQIQFHSRLEASPMKFPDVDLIDGCYYKHARRVSFCGLPVLIDLVANSYLDARYESPFAHKTNASTIHECQQKCVRLSKLGWLSMNVWCHLLGFDHIIRFSMFFFHGEMHVFPMIGRSARWTVRVSMEHIKLGWWRLINHNLPTFLENHAYFGSNTTKNVLIA